MKTISISLSGLLIVLLALLSGCTKNFNAEAAANDFFHVDVNGYYIPVMVRGNTAGGKILLFIQGGPGSNTLDFAEVDYPEWKNTLERDFAVAYYDQRGMGNRQGKTGSSDLTYNQYLTDLHRVAMVLREKYQAKIYFLGHSFGGYLTYRYMLAYGEEGIGEKYISVAGPASTDEDTIRWQFRRDFLINLAAEKLQEVPSRQEWQEVVDWCTAHPVIDELEEFRQWNRFVMDLIVPGFPEKIPGIKDYLTVALFSSYNFPTSNLNAGVSDEVASLLLLEEGNFQLISKLGQIKAPLLIIGGRYDDICPPEEIAYIMEHLGSIEKQSLILDDAAHTPFLDQGIIFREAIRAYLE